jgi:hypothetical protein
MVAFTTWARLDWSTSAHSRAVKKLEAFAIFSFSNFQRAQHRIAFAKFPAVLNSSELSFASLRFDQRR